MKGEEQNTFISAGEVLPPVGLVPDFINERTLGHCLSYLGAEGFTDAPDLLDLARRDRDPLAHENNREGYLPNHHAIYWLFGLIDFWKVTRLAEKHGATGGGAYLDFGGSTGRVFRHFIHQDSAWDVWSCDFKWPSVQWVSEHIPKAKVFLNTAIPHLPIMSESLDLITAFSVFTHIDQLELAWLLEFRRLLKRGAFAYVTVHDDFTWSIRETQRARPIFDLMMQFRPDIDQKAPTMPPGRTVVTHTDGLYRCNAYHPRSYVRAVWGRYFDIVDYVAGGHSIQSAYLLRKRS